MRRTFFLFLFSIIVSASIQAQSKLGLKFFPAVSSNQYALVDTLYDVDKAGSKFKFGIGLIYDYQLTDMYYFSTGVIFTPKYVGFEISEEDDQPTANYPNEPTEEYRVNYLQVPFSLKMFTNEIQPDTRVYFQVGVAMEIKVFEEPLEEEYDLVEFRAFDVPVVFGAGVEYRAGINTALFGGFTYQRGLINAIGEEDFGFQNDLRLYNTLLTLDIGLKF